VRALDDLTIAAYNRSPKKYAVDWLSQPPSLDLYRLLSRHFRTGPTADVGCGSGRDTAWLHEHGFDVVGYDASRGLLEEARRRYPEIDFFEAGLPDLEGVIDAIFDNVLCETVIMHLSVADIPAAVRRLTGLLRPYGTLYVSWRVTDGSDVRSGDDRLYSAFSSSLVLGALAGEEVLHDSEETSEPAGRTVHRVIARRTGS
jgi:SAM-dependent methyltransferase